METLQDIAAITVIVLAMAVVLGFHLGRRPRNRKIKLYRKNR